MRLRAATRGRTGCSGRRIGSFLVAKVSEFHMVNSPRRLSNRAAFAQPVEMLLEAELAHGANHARLGSNNIGC